MIDYARKLSGNTKPRKRNEFAFDQAVTDVSGVEARLLMALKKKAPTKNRETEEKRLASKSLQK